MSQHELADKLGISGDNKRRAMTRYEKGERNPKDERTKVIANILNINYNAIKKYDFHNSIDVIYTLIWLEELMPVIKVDLEDIKLYDKDLIRIYKGIHIWKLMQSRREKKKYLIKNMSNGN